MKRADILVIGVNVTGALVLTADQATGSGFSVRNRTPNHNQRRSQYHQFPHTANTGANARSKPSPDPTNSGGRFGERYSGTIDLDRP